MDSMRDRTPAAGEQPGRTGDSRDGRLLPSYAQGLFGEAIRLHPYRQGRRLVPRAEQRAGRQVIGRIVGGHPTGGDWGFRLLLITGFTFLAISARRLIINVIWLNSARCSVPVIQWDNLQ